MCAIVVPVYTDKLREDELLSIRHLQHHLGEYEVVVAVPRGLRIGELPYTYIEFDEECFANRDAYSQLLLSEEFYAAFQKHEFILIYQLDCLVFRNDLERWLNTGYDYIGAPLFSDMEDPTQGFSRVGNGGFSLRRIRAFLDVITSERYVIDSPSLFTDVTAVELPDLADKGPLERLKKKWQVLNSVRVGSEAYRKSYSLNEDIFWSDRARLFSPSFNVAPVEKGLKFSFNQFPEYCFRENGGELPFGCHGWNRWGREFWQDYLLPASE